jgi:hypothetical protein
MFLYTLRINERVWNTFNFRLYIFIFYALLSTIFSFVNYTEINFMFIINSRLRSYVTKWCSVIEFSIHPLRTD